MFRSGCEKHLGIILTWIEAPSSRGCGASPSNLMGISSLVFRSAGCKPEIFPENSGSFGTSQWIPMVHQRNSNVAHKKLRQWALLDTAGTNPHRSLTWAASFTSLLLYRLADQWLCKVADTRLHCQIPMPKSKKFPHRSDINQQLVEFTKVWIVWMCLKLVNPQNGPCPKDSQI